ncbi:MAG: hypothetical protein RL748_3563, partial [Pseudomonadota bacterium]
AGAQVGILGNLAIGRGADGKCNRSVLSFDTSAIPDDATITRAYVTVHYNTNAGNPWASPAGNSLVVDVKSGAYGATPNTESGDWAAAAGASNVASIARFTSGAKQSADFSAQGLAAIAKSGITQLKLRFASDQTSSSLYLFITKNATLHVEYQ